MIMMRLFLPLTYVTPGCCASGRGGGVGNGADRVMRCRPGRARHDAVPAPRRLIRGHLVPGVAGASGNPGVAGASGTGGGAGSVPSGIAGTGGSAASRARVVAASRACPARRAPVATPRARPARAAMRARAARRAPAVSPAPGATARPARAAAARRASPAPSARRARAAARRAPAAIPRAQRARAAAPRDRPARGGTAGTTGVAGTGGGTAGRGGSGGTGGPGNCTPMNCSDGCCSSAGVCIRARTVTQCGAQGQTCAPCGGLPVLLDHWPVSHRHGVALDDRRRGGKAGHRQQLGSEQRRSRRLGARSVLRIREPGGSGQQHDRGRDRHADRHVQPELESGDHAARRDGVGGDADGEQSRLADLDRRRRQLQRDRVLRRGRLHDPPDDHGDATCAAVSSSSPTASSAIR